MNEYIKKQILNNMKKLPLFEDFVPVGFGTNSMSTYSLGSSPRINTGYNMAAIVGPVMEAGHCIAKEAYSYEMNDNPEHKADSYIKEAKKHINEKIDEAYENYTTNEAMVQVTGKSKPSGAQVLASVIVDYLNSNLILPSNANKKKITEEIKQLIIDSTF
jgi:hypothetical protein